MLAAKRPREADRRSELLPSILRHCELHSSHIGLHDVAAFLESGDISADYYDAHSAEEISHHVASIWAAKLLLQVGTSSSSGAHASHRQRVGSSAHTAGPAASTAAAVTTATMHSADDEAGPVPAGCSPHSDEEGRSCGDMDSASDVDTMRHADGADARLELHHLDLGNGADGADAEDCDPDGGAGGACDFYGGKCSKQSRRLVWTDDLHRRFEDAVATLGSENAKPQAIQQLMNVDGITTRNIKSHLQKYRLRLHKQPSHCSGALSQPVASRTNTTASPSTPAPSSIAARPPSLAASHSHAEQQRAPMRTPTCAQPDAAAQPERSPAAGAAGLTTPGAPLLRAAQPGQPGGYELTQALSNTSMQSTLAELIAQHAQARPPSGWDAPPPAQRA